eukprot:scaffold22815_cov60-Phaeocystis_antarctica.AAC.6
MASVGRSSSLVWSASARLRPPVRSDTDSFRPSAFFGGTHDSGATNRTCSPCLYAQESTICWCWLLETSSLLCTCKNRTVDLFSGGLDVPASLRVDSVLGASSGNARHANR